MTTGAEVLEHQVDRKDIGLEIQETLQRIYEIVQKRQGAELDTVLFIPITGGEGAGKSTLLKSLVGLFDQQYIRTEVVKMLGGTDFANEIRQLALSEKTATASPHAAKLLFQTAMAEAANQARVWARESETDPLLIFADRSPFDTAAYQSFATQQQPREKVLQAAYANIALFDEIGMPPTSTWFITLDPAVGLARKYSQVGEVNRFEEMGLEFHQKVAEGFQLLMRDTNLSKQFVQLSGLLNPDELVLVALQQVEVLLRSYEGKVVVGQDAGLKMAKFWLDRVFLETGKSVIDQLDLKRVLRIINTAPFSCVGDLEYYFEQILRPLFFRLRDSQHMNLAEKKAVIETLRTGLLASKTFQMVVRDFVEDKTFLEEFKGLTDDEMISDGWRYINDIKDGWKDIIRYVETYDYEMVAYPYQKKTEN